MDIMQGTAFCPAVDVRDGDYADAVNSDLVVITVGIARKPGQTRIDLCKTNAKIMASVMPEITKYAPNACYIIVSNPVDVLTYEAIQVSGLNRSTYSVLVRFWTLLVCGHVWQITQT